MRDWLIVIMVVIAAIPGLIALTLAHKSVDDELDIVKKDIFDIQVRVSRMAEKEMRAVVDNSYRSLSQPTEMYEYYSTRGKSGRRCKYCGSPYPKEHGENCTHCGAYLPDNEISQSYFHDGGISVRPYCDVWKSK